MDLLHHKIVSVDIGQIQVLIEDEVDDFRLIVMGFMDKVVVIDGV